MKILPREFYLGHDTLTIARRLLGKIIETRFDNQLCRAMIVETEGYLAPEDQASHARNLRRTPRIESFYKIGGTAYVYISYGVHHLFNVVTQDEDNPHAILIRGVEPLSGLETMKDRRKLLSIKKNLTAGPGMLTQAMGIRVHHDGTNLCDKKSKIKIFENPEPSKFSIEDGPRIGIDTVPEPWLSKPFRYWIKSNPWVSR